MRCPIFSNSNFPSPRVVRAGEPKRIPEVIVGGFSSKGIPFLFTVMFASSNLFAASSPVIPLEETSTKTK